MALLKEEKQQILKHFRRDDLDTGSSEVQVAILTFEIKRLTEHFKANKKDFHGQRGLIRKVNKRRKLLDYLKTTKPEAYKKMLAELGFRK